ncbi:MAG TPA: lipid II flippase MurJ [Cytophagaceae bacterium]|jgi:putative peptidoglycan lipid II flippase|nr:lipid II flippase MurJ [Cytophagaceae bacterium]
MQAIRNIGIMTLLKIIASLLGLLYSILQVNYFGTSSNVEGYFVAASLMYLVVSLTQAGQLSEIFLPLYHKIKLERGRDAGFTVFSIILNTIGLYLFLGLVIVFASKDLLVKLIAPGFDAAQQTFTAYIFIAFLPLIFLQVITSFIITWFNAEGKFGRVEFLGVVNSFVSVLLLIGFHSKWGVWVLVVSIITGKAVEMLVYCFMMYRYGYRHQWILSVSYFNRILFFKNMMATLAYVLATQFYNIAITSSATLLPQGTYAIFSYAQQLYVKATGFLVQPIQTFFFSKYSKNVHANVQQEDLVPKVIRLYFTIYVLILSLVYWAGIDILDIVWRKNTNPDILVLGAGYLVANFATLIFSSIGGVYRKIAISHGEVKTLYSAWVLCQIGSAISIYLLTSYWGTMGLTFAILLNLGLLNITSIVIVYIKHYFNNVKALKPIVFKYCLLFIITFSLTGVIHAYMVDLRCNWFLSKYLNSIFKLASFSFVVVLLYLALLSLFGEFKFLLGKRN